MKTTHTDENGNTFFGTKEEAEKAFASLENCTDCRNCINCRNCTDCVNCTDCADCHNCYNCTYCRQSRDCTHSRRCTNCRQSRHCINCYNCNDCRHCKQCKYCTDCIDCSDCIQCDNCRDCLQCDNCKKQPFANIITPKYTICIRSEEPTMKIGCQDHNLDKWMVFNDREIELMDGSETLTWWHTWKPIIQELVRQHTKLINKSTTNA